MFDSTAEVALFTDDITFWIAAEFLLCFDCGWGWGGEFWGFGLTLLFDGMTLGLLMLILFPKALVFSLSSVY